MRLQYLHGENLVSLEVERDDEAWKITLPDGEARRIFVTRESDQTLRIEERTEERQEPSSSESPNSPVTVCTVPIVSLDDGIHVSYGGMTYRFQPYSGRASKSKANASSGILTAPMSGIVVDLLTTVGDRVEAYQPLAVIEAMKIMATLEAPFAGTVTAIHYQPKQQVAHGSPVIEIAPLAEADKS